jgi:hypothetical protein
MRRFSVVLVLALVAGCAKADKPAAEPAAVAPAAAPAPMAPAPIDMASVAGKWTVKTMPEGKDTVLVTATMTATADTTGWMLMLPNRKPVAMHVAVAGDSIMAWYGPYESVLRKGVQVSVSGAWHMVGGKLMGHQTAHYTVKTADSVLALRSMGEKAP